MGIRVAIVGTGFGVSTQLPGFRLAGGYDVVSLTGRDAAKTARLADQHDVPHALTDFRDALRVGSPDLMCVTTPPVHHREMALAALEAGCHCLLEKPMAMSAAEAEELTRAAAAVPYLAIVDHELRALPARQALKARLDAGGIGRPLMARVVFGSHGRARPGTRWSWWARADAGGGLWGAIGSHVIDSLRWFLGEVSEVTARLSTSIPSLPDEAGVHHAVETDDGADAFLTFASGAVGTISLTSVAHRYDGFGWEIHGTEGSQWLDDRGRLFAAARSRDTREDVSPVDPLEEAGPIDGSLWARGFVYLARDLRTAIESGGPAPTYAATFADGLAVQRVLDAGRR